MNLADRVQTFENMMPKKIITQELYVDLNCRGFFTAPASTKYHGAYEGGLFDHSANVTMCLLLLTKGLNLKWQRKESPYIIGMFHDLCKIDQYVCTGIEDGKNIYEYNKQSYIKGHGDKSVMLLSQYMSLTEEEIFCIRYHMGAFCEKEEWSDYTRAVHKYSNVLFTHTADMMAAHIMEVEHKDS